MASQVLSGSSNVSYTNNTGQNVRFVINFMCAPLSGNPSLPFRDLAINWAGISFPSFLIIGIDFFGKNVAHYANSSGSFGVSVSNAYTNRIAQGAVPTEFMLAPGQTFTASCGPYNVVVIPENG